MRAPHATLPFLLLASMLAASCGSTTIIYRDRPAGDDDAIIPEHGWLTLHNVQTARMAQGEAVERIWIRVDGVEVGECEVQYVDDDTCIKDVRLAPGTHQLRLAIQCRDANGNTLTCRYSGEESFTIAAGETIAYDFGASLQYPDEPDRYLVRTGREPIDADSCHGALELLATAPSCRGTDIAEAIALAERAADQCSDDELQADAGLSLVVQGGMNHFFQSPSHCIPESQMGRRGLPAIMLHPGSRESRWPPGTLPTRVSSWSWSRDGLPRRIIDERRGRQILNAIVTGLREIQPRVEVFYQMSGAYLEEGKRNAYANTVATRPFSLDARTPQGHATYLLVAMQAVDDAAFADYVGAGVGADRSLHCGTPGLAENVARHMTHDRVITPTEWEGITAMAERTPPDARYHGCDYVFRTRRTGVDHETRLRWLARYDCSDKRAPNARGRQLEPHLRDSMRGRGYDPLIDALRQQYSRCLAGR